MKFNFYFQLAKKNISTGAKTYIPYIFASALSIMMFSIIYTLSQEAFTQSLGGLLKALMEFGTIIIAFFSMIFIFYGNKFLIKNRVKEIGLYSILGLEKKHIAGVLFFEFLVCYFLSLILGAIGSLALGKLCFLILFKVSNINSKINYSISFNFLKPASIVFFCFFVLNYLYNLKKISLLNPIQLLEEAKGGEKKPKHSIIKTILGILFMGSGYMLSILSHNTIIALQHFLPAVLLVIAGTFFLFESISIFILSRMKKRKSYYKPVKFISVSGMIYRMGQHAKGLASICILLTMILLTIASVTSIYQAGETIIAKTFIRNHQFEVKFGDADMEAINGKKTIEAIKQIGLKNNIATEELLDIKYFSGIFSIHNNSFYQNSSLNFYKNDNLFTVQLTQLENIKQLFSKNSSEFLQATNIIDNNDEIIVCCTDKKFDYTKPLTIGKKEFKIKRLDTKFEKILYNYITSFYPFSKIILIAENSESMNFIKKELDSLEKGSNLGIKKTKGLMPVESFYWNTSADTLKKLPPSYIKELKDFGSSSNPYLFYDNKFEAAKSRREFDGTFLFLGAFLSIVFLIWLILIMYFKQISEGLQDRKRYQIMLKIGMDYSLIKKTSHSQMLWLFILPVLVSIIHCLFASPIFTLLLLAFGLFDKLIFFVSLLLSGVLILVLYLIFYKITSNKYNKIIR